MTARGDLFDALFQAAVLREKTKPPDEQHVADSDWVRQQQAEITEMLNCYDHETAERVRARGRRWKDPHSIVWLVVGDWLDPEVRGGG